MNKLPDKERAKSLIQNSIKDLKYTLTLNISEESANTIVRNIYESFRMLGEAILLKKGIRPIQAIDNLRKIRHGINYYGYIPKKEEADDAILLAKEIFKEVLDKAKNRVSF